MHFPFMHRVILNSDHIDQVDEQQISTNVHCEYPAVCHESTNQQDESVVVIPQVAQQMHEKPVVMEHLPNSDDEGSECEQHKQVADYSKLEIPVYERKIQPIDQAEKHQNGIEDPHQHTVEHHGPVGELDESAIEVEPAALHNIDNSETGKRGEVVEHNVQDVAHQKPVFDQSDSSNDGHSVTAENQVPETVHQIHIHQEYLEHQQPINNDELPLIGMN